MYTCTVTVCFAGCPDHVVEVIQAIQPLSPFTHEFTVENSAAAAHVAAADVVIAGPELGQDARRALPDIMRADAELVLLTQGECALPAALLARAVAVWRMPMPDEELRFHFSRWQEWFKQGKELWQTRQFLECTLDTAPNLIWFKDKNGVHELVNASFCRTVNKPREQVQGRKHAYIWNVEADDPACIESERIVMESGEMHVSEETIETGAGRRMLMTYKAPLRNVDGSMMGTMGIAVDVTQERLYQEKLLRNNATLEAMFTTMDCGILYHSLDGSRIISVNRAALELLDFASLDEMQSSGFQMIASTVMEEDRPKLREAISRLKNVGDSTSYEYRIKHADGRLLHVVGNAKLVEKDGEIVCQRFLLDCTAQKLKEEEEQSRKERRQKDLVRALCVDYQLVCVLDPDARDDSILQLMEYPDQNLGRIFSADMPFPQKMEMYIRTCVHPDDQEPFRRAFSTEALKAELTNKKIYYFNYRVLDGEEVYYFQLKAVRAGDLDAPYGIIIGLQSVDASTRKELEQKSRLSEALKQAKKASTAKSIFLSNMSHDIRTPINAVVGYTSLALAHLDRREQVEGYLQKILSSGNHLINLINDILDMSHIESGKIQLEEMPCELPVLLHELWNIVQPAAGAKNQKLTIETENIRDEHVYCDKLRLNRVLLNLLSNSIKYTGEGGVIDLHIAQEDCALPCHAAFVFRIRDTGIGMSEDFLTRIFEPFERAQTSTMAGTQGTGLGMTITKSIVEMMKGEISVRSKPNVGTEFTLRVTFRLAEDQRARSDRDAVANLAVLVVDADRRAAENTARLLRGRGLHVDVAAAAKDALRLFGQQSGSYALCLIDRNLPGGGGEELARRIDEQAGVCRPRMVLTCDTWGETRKTSAEDIFDAWLGKPLFWSDVCDCLLSSAEASSGSDKRRCARAGRLLLAEDNAMNQEIAKEFLTEAGYMVEVASNGQEAVQMLTASAPGYYDVILMDVQMPVLDGYGATKRIRELEDPKLASIPIVAMTANSFEEDKQEGLMRGMNEYITKPIDFNILFSTLDTIFGRDK